MSGRTYKTSGIVLRKTKLAEKDLIVTVLGENGSLLRAVAKGARRPGGSYAARLELFSVVDLVLAQGRNLDVITGATFAPGHEHVVFGMEQAACASVLAELLAVLAQEDLPHERLYSMSKAAFVKMASGDPAQSLALLCSALLKALAYAGFRPSFSTCTQCGQRIDLAQFTQPVYFSYEEGGITCGSCRQPPDAVKVDAALLQWSEALMRSRFDELDALEPPTDVLLSIVQFAKQWTRAHAGKTLKSVDFLLLQA